MTPATQRARHASRIRWAEEELRTFDRAMVVAWRSARSTIATAMQATGCEAEKARADDHLDDLFADVFGAQRIKLLFALDDAGGNARASAHPWPIPEDET